MKLNWEFLMIFYINFNNQELLMLNKIAAAFYLSVLLLFIGSSTAQKQKVLTYQNLDLSPLRNLNVVDTPMDKDYSYQQAFKKLDVNQLKKDLQELLTKSQDWWPADFGNYGPFFIRLSWHAAGTYRVFDGRGGGNRGQQRFSPLNSWPDNVNLDKARQLLWPIKQKYGDTLSWSDLLVLAGTVAIDSMGLKTLGFAFGRQDDWQGDDTIWGFNPQLLSSNVKNGSLQNPFSATQMGLIYINPEGPGGKPDRVGATKDIRAAFSGMGMDDRETVALIAGGHTFGKTHGSAPSNKYVGPAPDKALLQQQGKGWASGYGTGIGNDTISSGLEGTWTSVPTKWSHDFLKNLYELNWKQTKSPGGAHQWIPTNATQQRLTPGAFNQSQKRVPVMLTTDLALTDDESFNKYASQFYKNPKQFAKAFAQAWFKLTHRDMGPKSRYLGPWVPKQDFIWQDPVPTPKTKQLLSQHDINQLKLSIISSGLTIPELIRTAWSSASTYRKTDYRGGANGARISLLPQREWEINQPLKLNKVLNAYKKIQRDFNKCPSCTQVSLADLIIIGGNLAVENAAIKAGYYLQIPCVPGRTDATQAQTDVESFKYLRSKSDGFINYSDDTENVDLLPQALVQKASMLTLNVPEMTVLFGGLRALGVVYGGAKDGVLTSTPGVLNNNFFINLLDSATEWKKGGDGKYVGIDRKSGKQKWTATSTDLIFGYNSELKAVAQHYAQNSSMLKFVRDFGKAWHKVMMLGRFQLKN